MIENKYYLTPKSLQENYKVNDWEKMWELCKENHIICEGCGFVHINGNIDFFGPEHMHIGCGVLDYEGVCNEYECGIDLYINGDISCEYLFDAGEHEWVFEEFGKGNEKELQCQEKILKVMNYLIEEKIVIER